MEYMMYVTQNGVTQTATPFLLLSLQRNDNPQLCWGE